MNEITTVCNTFVYKRYGLIEKSCNEVQALSMLSQIIPENVPRVLGSWENLCVFESVKGQNGSECGDNKLITEAVTDIIIGIYKGYEPLSESSPSSWNNSTKKLINEFELESNVLERMGYKNLKKSITDRLAVIVNEASDSKKLTLVHRDLHLGNVILKDNTCVLLDFEHAMEAPIELEFQNSLFWNDDMSLDVVLAKSILRSKGIYYSDELEKLLMAYYIADQFVIALKEQNFAKADLIGKKTLKLL
jgi:hypothetical protein